MEKIRKIIYVTILFCTAFILFLCVKVKNPVNGVQTMEKFDKKTEANLVIFGDNIKTEVKPFMYNTGMYLPFDIIKKYLDEYIYYDKYATKVIVTTRNDVYKLKVDEKNITKNFENISIDNPAIIENGNIFVDVNYFKDEYSIKLSYNSKSNTISIDNLNVKEAPIKYNDVKVYSDINTKSNILTTLSKKNNVAVYTESLKHNRWYKVKSDDGAIGYISKNNVDIVNNNEGKNEKREQINNDKLTMFWQYGSNLNVLGDKIDGVDVCLPTWYELKNSSGEISSKYSKSYYNKAKANGYKIWPIVTNGIDSVDYMPNDTSTMLNSEVNRENFIKNLLKIAKENKIDGINIDFEAMKEEDRLVYTQFIRELAPIFRKENIKVSVDMYFVKYIDRKGIGAASDYVILMGYDQRGNWSSSAGSIAEIPWVEKNIDSLINSSKIPSEKIILGIPFYTRLWIEKNGGTSLKTEVYSMPACQKFLRDYNLTAKKDEKSGQNYAEYKKGEITYKLWIEDLDSLKNRVEIVNKYNLAGISAWQKGLEINDVWNTIKENMK